MFVKICENNNSLINCYVCNYIAIFVKILNKKGLILKTFKMLNFIATKLNWLTVLCLASFTN